MSILGLLDCFADIPAMPHAACREHVETFDKAASGSPVSQREAHTICLRQCPHLVACTEWVASLDPAERRDLGVAGGIILTQPRNPPGKPRKSGDTGRQAARTAARTARRSQTARAADSSRQRRSKTTNRKAS